MLSVLRLHVRAFGPRTLAVAALSLCLIVTLTVLSTKATMAMGLPV